MDDDFDNGYAVEFRIILNTNDEAQASIRADDLETALHAAMENVEGAEMAFDGVTLYTY